MDNNLIRDFKQVHLVSYGNIYDNVNLDENINIIIITKDNRRKSYHDFI